MATPSKMNPAGLSLPANVPSSLPLGYSNPLTNNPNSYPYPFNGKDSNKEAAVDYARRRDQEVALIHSSDTCRHQQLAINHQQEQQQLCGIGQESEAEAVVETPGNR
ncbi:hypothetical protein ACLKA7_013189 [Drosophila subpalustris]